MLQRIRPFSSSSFPSSSSLLSSSFSSLSSLPLRRTFAAVPGPEYSSSNIVYPNGFKVGGITCGLKKKAGKLDMALIKSMVPANGAAVFTKNRVAAAPVQVSRSILSKASDQIGGIIINSGCANACTGDKGVEDAWKMSEIASQAAGIKNTLVMSTGVIGPFLDMTKIAAGAQLAAKAISGDHAGWKTASEAIMTTDTVPKLVSEKFNLPDGRSFTLAGIAKGAGMIHPNMATMLSIIATDAKVPVTDLKTALNYAVLRSFNNISIDGDTSTNDTLAVLANGQSTFSIQSPADFEFFQRALTRTAARLSHMIVRDGEGATKFVTVSVSGAASFDDARTVATSICTSALVKTALFGMDANWGRIICAAGYSGAPIDPMKVNLWFVDESETGEEDDEGKRPILVDRISAPNSQSLHLVYNGRPHNINEERALALLKKHNIYIHLNLGQGNANATMWTCDFSYDYVKINADYRS